ncbi:MAG: hypothetical protein HOP33_13430, partial [Verrucomicrobia bacterium]|nr:hypothetical protein [Verrucomicrobiota bacterium]
MNVVSLHSTAYGWLMLAGIFVSIALWSRVAKRDSRLVLVYIAALAVHSSARSSSILR